MSQYFVTVCKNDDKIVDRKPFDDYQEAILFLNNYYKPRGGRCVLSLLTEVINGKFARSIGDLNVPESIEGTDELSMQRYSKAAKYSCSFDYDASYLFIIESEHGISDIEAYVNDDGD